MPVQIQAIGTVEAFSVVSIKAQVGGELMRVHFKEGQDVKKGELLFTIDPRSFEAALAQAQANLARDKGLIQQARAALDRDRAKVSQTQAALARDKAQAKNAEVEAARYAELLKRGLIAQEQADQFRTTAESLSHTVLADEADIKSAEETVRADEAAINSAQQAVRADEAAVDNAQIQLGYTTIRSPIDGRTGSLMLHEGNVVRAERHERLHPGRHQPGPAHLRLVHRAPAAAPDHQAVHGGRAARRPRHPRGRAASLSRASSRFIDNAVDQTTGTIRLKATFANEEKRLWPGQFVNVELTLTVDPEAIVVPSAALQSGQQGQYVFVVKDGLHRGHASRDREADAGQRDRDRRRAQGRRVGRGRRPATARVGRQGRGPASGSTRRVGAARTRRRAAAWIRRSAAWPGRCAVAKVRRCAGGCSRGRGTAP